MASEAKKRKVDKRHHWGRGGNFLKSPDGYKGVKGLDFYTPSQRQHLKRELMQNLSV